ncbi:MAG: erythromycin esterase family protein [Phycisphaerales bacterium]|nr:erythromycin esterase family protein [Phycisphaerales bacterium]
MTINGGTVIDTHRFSTTFFATLVAAAVPALAEPPPATLTPEQAAWLAANAHELKTVEAGNGFDDLAPLRAMVGDARIVALGEGTHGTREHFQAKHRMLEYLVEELGFSIFSIEANMPESYELNPYVLGETDGDVNELIGGMYFWTWNTEEVRDMVEWMRSYNRRQKEAGSDRRVQFTGNDMQTQTVALRIVREFLEAHDAEYAASNQASFEAIRTYNPYEAGGFGCVTGSLPVNEFHNKTLKLSGWVKTRALSIQGFAGLWLRVDGPTPYFNNMQSRGLNGDTEWTYVEQEVTVPADAMAIYFGLVMPGSGEAWFDGVELTIDGQAWTSPLFDLDFESGAPRGLLHADPSGGPPPPGYEYAIDSNVAKVGSRSARLASKATAVSPGSTLATASAILEHMRASRDRYAAATSPAQADWAIQNARVVEQWAGMTADMTQGSAHRDKCMAENVGWILDQNPGARAVLWAHNWHVRDESPWMGSHLRARYGKDYVNLAFCSSSGQYYAVNAGRGGMGVHALQEPPPDSFEAMLQADGRPILLVDLRAAVPGDPASGWLTESRPFGGVIGALQMPHHYFPAQMRGPFDLLLYIRDTTAARQLPTRAGRR